MQDSKNPQTADVFDRLLDAMPRIAEAVNAFSSEENQRAALDALVQAIGIPHEPPDADASDRLTDANDDRTVGPEEEPAATDAVERSVAEHGARTTTGPKATSRRRRTARKWEPVRNINFRPEGEQAFKDLVAEKQPSTIDQKNVLAVWWLEQVAEVTEIGVGQVLAAYKECDWREPANPDNALQITASREHWIDTKNMRAITTTPSGRNVVQFDMPIKKASGKNS